MTRASLELLLIAGWTGQILSWLWALARTGRRAATSPEWLPELLLRAGVIALAAWAIVGPRGGPHSPGDAATTIAAICFLAGHALAIAGRLQLARAWGIGTRPRADLAAPVRSGVYRLVAHPIYLGISIALLAQVVLVRNLPALLLVLSAAVVNPWKIVRERRWLRHRPAPGPPGHWLLGHVPAFRRDPLAFLREAVRTWGDVVALRIAWRRAYLISRPEDVQRVLADDVRYSKNSALLGRLRVVLGRGLVTSTGALWRRQRQLVQPAFQPRSLALLSDAVTNAVAEVSARWGAGRDARVDVHGEMMALAFCVVGETMFGADVRPHAGAVRAALAEIQRQTNERIDALLSIPLWVPTPRNRAFQRALATLDDVVRKIIATRTAGSSSGHADFLSTLLGSMNARQLRDEIVTLLIAGHENTGNALTWMWYLLARHPAVMDRVCDELDRVLEGGSRVPSANDLPRLPYLRMVVEETVRLYPGGWLLARRATAEDTIAGFPIERGAIILFSPYLIHRHPQHWRDPETFDPERFRETPSATRHRFAYLPFGAGARKCVGSAYAVAEMQLVLAGLAGRFRFELEPGQAPVPLPVVSLPPQGGLRMRVRDSSLIAR